MQRDVLEVIARWGETVVDVAHVSSADRYTIGTAPGVRLPVVGFGCFAVIDRGQIRTLAGMTRRERTTTTVIGAGSIELSITPVRLAMRDLPRPRIERRTPAITALVLVAHLALWLVAMVHAPIEQLVVKKPPHPRLVRVVHAPPPEPPQTEAARQEPPAPEQQQPGIETAPPRRTHAKRRADEVRVPTNSDLATGFALNKDNVSKLFDDAGPVVDPSEAGKAGFGERTRMEIPPTVPSGGYVIYNFPNMKQCVKGDPRCRLAGPTKPLHVRSHMLEHMTEIQDCVRASASGPATLLLTFTIKGDGSVEHARGQGPGESGECAAQIVSSIVFKAQWPRDDSGAYDTRVMWPIAFR